MLRLTVLKHTHNTHQNSAKKKKREMNWEKNENFNWFAMYSGVIGLLAWTELSYPQPDYEQRHRSALLLKRLLFLVDHFCDWIFSHYSISIFLLAGLFFAAPCLCVFSPAASAWLLCTFFFFVHLVWWWPVFCFFFFCFSPFCEPFLWIRYTQINCSNTFFDKPKKVVKLWSLGNG